MLGVLEELFDRKTNAGPEQIEFWHEFLAAHKREFQSERRFFRAHFARGKCKRTPG